MIASDSSLGQVAEQRGMPVANGTSKPFARRAGRRNSDVLGLAWLHGTLQAAVFRRQAMINAWESLTVIRTFEEFEAGVDAALTALGFCGTEVFLILEHDQFVHQAEHAPAFSDSAARAYLRGRVQRYEKEREPVLWISQRTVSVRQDSAFLLHMLPTAIHARLVGFLVTRHLDLTRIIPLVVPLQLLLEETPVATQQMVLMAAEAGDATTLMVVRGNGELLFSRTMLARWESDPARIAVEVNRSLLYAKQQFGAVVERIELLGSVSETVKAEVQARCGVDKVLSVRPTNVQGWLQAVARLSPRHPVNLVVSYLGRKRRRQFLRRVLLAGCWLGVGLMMFDAASRIETLQQNEAQLARLQSAEPQLLAERETLRSRTEELSRHRTMIREASDERLPPVAPRLLAFLASIRSPNTQFTDFSARWDATASTWSFRLDGQIEGDEETARDSVAALQRNLEKSPFAVRLNDGLRTIVLVPPASPDAPSAYRFALEGGLFEK